MEDFKLRYPLGQFVCPDDITAAQIQQWIHELETLPHRLVTNVLSFTDDQLDTPYREGGWTVRQVIHHIADSHHHSYTRFKWALTKDTPLIKAYEEKSWSSLFDAKKAPVALSLNYIKVLHAKLVYLLNGLTHEQMQRCYLHPENNTKVRVAENIGKYAWHGNHHLAQIQHLALKKAW